MGGRELINFCISKLKEYDIDKYNIIFSESSKDELNFSNKDFSLLRSTMNEIMDIKIIKDNKKAQIGINNFEEYYIEEKVKELVDMCNSSESDEANDIAKFQEKEEFNLGEKEGNLNSIIETIERFLKDLRIKYPEILITDDSNICFNRKETYFMNSNGVDFKINKGIYNLSMGFSAKIGEKSSSFNGVEYSFEEVPKDLMNYKNLENKLRESVEQVNVRKLGEKFKGDIILTPSVVSEFLYYYRTIFLGEDPLITGSSRLRDKLNEKVTSEKFTLRAVVTGEEIIDKDFITSDGLKTKDTDIIENGILKSYFLSVYGAKKTNKPLNPIANSFVVESGDKSLEDIIKETNKGIIFDRFSGGNPAANGDISGVAKGCYYIEDGEKKDPLVEVMISGNLYDMFNDIENISLERINDGKNLLPWIRIRNVVISGN
ncbi:TldD/PmbA family protein [Clostridium sp.]|uniref:TldD/PmbA family protein n=1 Tax=Clostridium sp. TaxID=1506 RepID=UPI00346470FC